MKCFPWLNDDAEHVETRSPTSYPTIMAALLGDREYRAWEIYVREQAHQAQVMHDEAMGLNRS